MSFAFLDIILVSSILVLTSVLLSKSSNKFGLPILVVFLALGMIMGSEGPGGIQYSDYGLTHSLSLIAICLIIFSGGIMTRKEDIEPIFKTGVSLSSLGVFLTTAFVGAFSYYYLRLPLYESLLVGAILSSTDAAAVFTAFRDKNAQVTKNVKSVLEFESGSNDPMAYLLVAIFLGLFQGNYHLDTQSIYAIILNPVLGFIGGYVSFRLFKAINDATELDFQGLYPALTLSFLFLTYSLVSKFDGNGFLAVYVFAINLGNTKVVHKKALVNFFDGLAWLSQIGLFIMLGLLVFPTRLMSIAPEAITVALFLAVVARPVSVFIATAFSQFNFKSKLFISWAGLKGATPIVFASFVATKIGGEASLIFDIVFFTVLVSAVLQGMTLKPLARRLHLLFEAVEDPQFPVDLEVLNKTKNGIREYKIEEYDYAVDKRIVDLDLFEGVLVLFIKRNGSFIIPNGSTSLMSMDKVLIVTPDKKQVEEVVECFKNGKQIEEETHLDVREDNVVELNSSSKVESEEKKVA